MISNSDDSSTDDETTARLKEALETGFAKANLYTQIDKCLDVTIKKEIPPEIEPPPLQSIRNSFLHEDEFDNLGVTPEFQKFVAKKLAIILDNQIEEIKLKKDKKRKRKHTGGIQLLKNSQIFLNDCDEIIVEDIKIKKQPTKKQDDSITEEDLKCIVVSTHDILSQKDVKFWSKRTKRKPYDYRQQNDGSLVLIEPKFI